MRLICLCLALFLSEILYASPLMPGHVPRFASLRSDFVYGRVGPGEGYPVEWIYTRSLMPLKIIKDHQTWRLVEDKDGQKSWIHKRLLSGLRTVVFVSSVPVSIHKEPSKKSFVIAHAEPGVIALLDKQEGEWVRVKIEKYVGWVIQDALWGVKFG
ncbi:MAG: hypothetical protein H6849_04745 [Alphaproteobacteria bacterium]|nr:MAG: hypothetical protein H6849_04745 [Alphaproteobacteria bacterium]